jgi:hypothetical protein
LCVSAYLNDENPSPAVQASDAIHQRDRSSQQSTEGTCERRSREEERSTETKLRALVPARKIVINALRNVSVCKIAVKQEVPSYLGRDRLLPDPKGIYMPEELGSS